MNGTNRRWIFRDPWDLELRVHDEGAFDLEFTNERGKVCLVLQDYWLKWIAGELHKVPKQRMEEAAEMVKALKGEQ